MQNSLRPPSLFTWLVVVLPSIAQAHPGHDEHELTWDFGHLAAHPLATLGCVAVLAGSVWLLIRLARRPDRRASS